MSHAQSSETPQLRGTPSRPPSALKLHRLGWNGGEASVEADPGFALREERVRSTMIALGASIRERRGRTTNHSAIDSPAVIAARLTGTRRAYVSCLVDGDLATVVRRLGQIGVGPARADIMVNPGGRLVWETSPLPGSVAAYAGAEFTLGGRR